MLKSWDPINDNKNDVGKAHTHTHTMSAINYLIKSKPQRDHSSLKVDWVKILCEDCFVKFLYSYRGGALLDPQHRLNFPYHVLWGSIENILCNCITIRYGKCTILNCLFSHHHGHIQQMHHRQSHQHFRWPHAPFTQSIHTPAIWQKVLKHSGSQYQAVQQLLSPRPLGIWILRVQADTRKSCLNK